MIGLFTQLQYLLNTVCTIIIYTYIVDCIQNINIILKKINFLRFIRICSTEEEKIDGRKK